MPVFVQPPRAARAAYAAVAMLCASASAAAHITASPDQGVANSYFQTALMVPHGCQGSSTVAVKVTVPPGVYGVKPQMKSGWLITIKKRPIDPPLKNERGEPINQTVSEIEWRGGPLPADQFDSFGLLMKLPDGAGQTVYLPVLQTGEQGVRNWSAIPAAGQAWHSLESPAPFVRLVSAVR